MNDLERIKELAKAWMEEFARPIGMDGQAAINIGKEFLETGERYTFDTVSDSNYTGEHAQEYWQNFEIITGIPARDEKGNPFGEWSDPFDCSC